MDRRKFLHITGRSAILIGLFAITGSLLVRRKKGETQCLEDLVCRDCSKLNSCRLPEALDYKKTIQK